MARMHENAIRKVWSFSNDSVISQLVDLICICGANGEK